MRTYLDGPLTLDARERIVATYLNSTPLELAHRLRRDHRSRRRPLALVRHRSRRGERGSFGLRAGRPRAEGRNLQAGAQPAARPAPPVLLPARRPRRLSRCWPTSICASWPPAASSTPTCNEAALAADLQFLKEPPALGPVSFVSQKAFGTIRTELLRLLRAPSLYDLDRLDLSVDTTFDSDTQKDVSEVLANVGKRDEAKALAASPVRTCSATRTRPTSNTASSSTRRAPTGIMSASTPTAWISPSISTPAPS